MSSKKSLLVTISTAQGGSAKRLIQIPASLDDAEIDYPGFMRRAETEARDIGVVRSIEFTDSDQKLIPWRTA